MELTARHIRLHAIEIRNDTTFIYHYEVGSYLKRFISPEPLWVRYDRPVSEIPPAIAAIPFLGWAFPWAGFFGGSIEIPVLDRLYADSIQSLGSVFQESYPQLKIRSPLNIIEKVRVTQHFGNRTAQLFTGGIDSFATALAHKTENPLLITFWGSEERVNQKNVWDRVYEDRSAIAERLGLQMSVIASNCYDILQTWAIETYFPVKLTRPWNLEVAFGLIFTALAAPLTWQEEIGTLYFSSTFTADDHPLDGSHPQLVNKIAWTGTRVILEGLSDDRQTKIERFSETLDREFPGLKFLVCTTPQVTGNCSTCERCSCTMTGLALTGIDPSQHGFSMTPDTPSRIRRAIELRQWSLDFLSFWQQIQRGVPKWKEKVNPCWQSFFDWFESADLDIFLRERPTSRQKTARRFIKRMLPYVLLRGLRKIKLLWMKNFS